MTLPNIIYLHSHDTGRFIQPYGYNVPTPNLQRLAEESVLFRQAFCAAPTCSPSRAALLTGQSPHSAGILGLAHRGFELPHSEHHIIHQLHPLGYTSALCGIQHVRTKAEDVGYKQILQPVSRNGEDVAAAAADYIAHAPEQPFFLSVGFFETHREFTDVELAEGDYQQPPPTLPDTPQTRQDFAAYVASAKILDDSIGTVLRAVDEANLWDNTLIISTTDHGIAFPQHKCTLTDRGMGVLLMLCYPAAFPAGKVVDGMVSHIDVYPTICNLLDIEPPEWLQGKSLLPLVRGEVDQINDEIFAEVTYHAAYEPKRAVRTLHWKYIRHFGNFHLPILPNCDDSPSKTEMVEHGWDKQPVPHEELYNLMLDPLEMHNLAYDPAASLVLNDMCNRLDRWMERTEDPLLRGDVPIPDGGFTNSQNGYSPKG